MNVVNVSGTYLNIKWMSKWIMLNSNKPSSSNQIYWFQPVTKCYHVLGSQELLSIINTCTAINIER